MDVQILRKDIIAKEAQISSLKADITKLQQTVASQTRELNFKETYITRLRAALKTRATDLKVDERILYAIVNGDGDRKRVTALETENQQLKAKNTTCKQLIAEITNATTIAKNALVERKEEVRHLRAQLAEVHQAKGTSGVLLQEIKELSEKKENLETKVHKLLEENATVTQLNQSLQAVQNDLLVEYGELKDRYEELLRWKEEYEGKGRSNDNQWSLIQESHQTQPARLSRSPRPAVETREAQVQAISMVDQGDLSASTLEGSNLRSSNAPSYGIGIDKSQTVSSLVEKLVINDDDGTQGSKVLDNTCANCINLYRERDKLKAETSRLSDELSWTHDQIAELTAQIETLKSKNSILERDNIKMNGRLNRELERMASVAEILRSRLTEDKLEDDVVQNTKQLVDEFDGTSILLNNIMPKYEKMIILIANISKIVVDSADSYADGQKILNICHLIISSDIPEVMTMELKSMYNTDRVQEDAVKETPAVLKPQSIIDEYVDDVGLVLNSPTATITANTNGTRSLEPVIERVNNILNQSMTSDYTFGSYSGDADLIKADQKLKELHQFIDVHTLHTNV